MVTTLIPLARIWVHKAEHVLCTIFFIGCWSIASAEVDYSSSLRVYDPDLTKGLGMDGCSKQENGTCTVFDSPSPFLRLEDVSVGHGWPRWPCEGQQVERPVQCHVHVARVERQRVDWTISVADVVHLYWFEHASIPQAHNAMSTCATQYGDVVVRCHTVDCRVVGVFPGTHALGWTPEIPEPDEGVVTTRKQLG